MTSHLVQTEIAPAPAQVREFFAEMLELAEVVHLSQEAVELQSAYLDAGIVTAKSMADALHVAMATVAGCSIIVSWNFKHIVSWQKIPLYRAVNTLKGYTEISIYTPIQVMSYGEA